MAKLSLHKVARYLKKHENDFSALSREAARQLGGLAPWMLSPKACEAAGAPAPTLPDSAGSAVVLCVHRDGGDLEPWINQGVFACAFALPLQWEKNTPHSALLPQSFGELAQAVLEDLEITSPYGLRPGLSWSNGLDLSGINVTAGSGWVPLAAALVLLDEGGTPDPLVFSTGCWRKKGVEGVKGIEDKIDAVAALAANGRATFFVPAANFDQARSHDSQGVDIVSFNPGESRPKNAIQGLLARLDCPPTAPDVPLQDRCDYANRFYVRSDRDRRQEYYIEHLLDALARRISDNRSQSGELQRLVLGVGTNWELASVLLAALEPQEVGLLCTSLSQAKIAEDARAAALAAIKNRWILDDDARNAGRLCDDIAGFLDGGPAAVEFTGGTKEMSTVLLVAAQRAGAQVLYLKHDMVGFAPKYGTGRIVRLEWAEPSQQT